MLAPVGGRRGLAASVAVVLAAAVITLVVRSQPLHLPASPVGGSGSGPVSRWEGGGATRGAPPLGGWESQAAGMIDASTLSAAGIELPAGANVFAGRIYGGGPAPAYRFYEAGGGAFARDFYPASSVKLLAALGALDYLASLGFTGAAVIDGGSRLRDTYDAAIRWSSNEDYDQLVRIAGMDRLNRQFLPGQGYTRTVIQEAYAEYDDLSFSPPMHLAEGDREMDIPARTAAGAYGCDGHNCSSLFELADAVRRVVLDAELPAGERFVLAPGDMSALRDALLGAEAWITPGVVEALGPGAEVFSKPGYVFGRDCVDDAVIDAPGSGNRYLIALSVPDEDGCDLLPTLAAHVLAVLDRQGDGAARRADGSLVEVAGGRQVAR